MLSRLRTGWEDAARPLKLKKMKPPARQPHLCCIDSKGWVPIPWVKQDPGAVIAHISDPPPTWLPPDVVFAGAIPYRSSDTTWANFPTTGFVGLVLFWGGRWPVNQDLLPQVSCVEVIAYKTSHRPPAEKSHSFWANGNGEVRGKAMWMVKLQNKLCNYTWLKHITWPVKIPRYKISSHPLLWYHPAILTNVRVDAFHRHGWFTHL